MTGISSGLAARAGFIFRFSTLDLVAGVPAGFTLKLSVVEGISG